MARLKLRKSDLKKISSFLTSLKKEEQHISDTEELFLQKKERKSQRWNESEDGDHASELQQHLELAIHHFHELGEHLQSIVDLHD